jgi:hypothetical protein
LEFQIYFDNIFGFIKMESRWRDGGILTLIFSMLTCHRSE